VNQSGKLIIGLTGNIASGKSLVRRFLEHEGAFGIDADLLARQAVLRGTEGYGKVLAAFGEEMIAADGEIDRKRMAALVFSNPLALEKLEAIIHPYVHEYINQMLENTSQKIIVIEAIKLLESRTKELCDQIWVVAASREKQIERLMGDRGMTLEGATLRVSAQPDPQLKVNQADVVIHNSGSLLDLWKAVDRNWQAFLEKYNLWPEEDVKYTYLTGGKLQLRKGTPGNAGKISDFLQSQMGGGDAINQEEILQSFADTYYRLIMDDEQIKGLAAWQIHGSLLKINRWVMDNSINSEEITTELLKEVENSPANPQGAISLILSRDSLTIFPEVLENLGFELVSPHENHYPLPARELHLMSDPLAGIYMKTLK
jgi:dephospho-CoA kinase